MRFFDAIFVALSNATFVAAISLRFRVRCFLQFPSNHCQIALTFEHVRNMCDIPATIRPKIALKSLLVYTRDVMMQRELKINTKSLKSLPSCINFRTCSKHVRYRGDKSPLVCTRDVMMQLELEN